ncbi:MAG TPA: ATP-binding protein [Deinococcales bacterium]|nr:ATP-binding protein [Deinococcales bacterium]
MPGTIHALHGFIGTGKTTLARRLEAELPAVRFTPDEWMAALYGTDPPAEVFAEYLARVRALLERQWTRCVELGLDVVLDGGLWSRAERDELRGKAQALGARLFIHDLTVPDEVALARVLRRNEAEPGHLLVTEDTYWLLKARFEPLAGDELAAAAPTA